MTTTETPNDNSTSDAPDPAATTEPSHAPAQSEPATNGEAQAAAVPSTEGESSSESDGEGDEGEHETGDPETSGGDASGAQQTGAAGATGEKKKRRRRRKKKPHEAGEGGAEARPEGSTEEASVEGATAEGTDEHAAPKPRDKKKEKKHGPARERPPVNGGDIVFGKIIEITAEAIIIDIPGKAKAIFDRREMLPTSSCMRATACGSSQMTASNV